MSYETAQSDNTADFEIDDHGVLVKYNGTDRVVILPDGITEIGEQAFFGCCSLTNITIPKNVTSIGEDAFYGCSNLTNVTVSVKLAFKTWLLDGEEYCMGDDMRISLEEWAFSDCPKLAGFTVFKGMPPIDVSHNGANRITVPNGNP